MSREVSPTRSMAAGEKSETVRQHLSLPLGAVNSTAVLVRTSMIGTCSRLVRKMFGMDGLANATGELCGSPCSLSAARVAKIVL